MRLIPYDPDWPRQFATEMTGDRHLLAAGIPSNRQLVVVTDRTIYIGWRLLFFTVCEKYLHEPVSRYQLKGLFTTKLRLRIDRWTMVDMPTMLTEIACPVYSTIVHV